MLELPSLREVDLYTFQARPRCPAQLMFQPPARPSCGSRYTRAIAIASRCSAVHLYCGTCGGTCSGTCCQLRPQGCQAAAGGAECIPLASPACIAAAAAGRAW